MSSGSSKPAKPLVSWGWRSALVVSVLSFVLAQLVVAVILVALGWNIDQLNLSQTYFVGTLSVTLPLGGLLLFLSRRQIDVSQLGLAGRPKPFIKPLVKAFGWYVLSTTLAVFLLSIVAPSLDLNQAQDLGLGGGPQVWYEYLWLALLLMVFTPVSEEILFRGFLLKGLAGRFGWTAAAAATAVLFGLAHGQVNVAIDTAIMGWWSAQLVITTGSLWPSMVLHGLKNTIAFALVYLWPLL